MDREETRDDLAGPGRGLDKLYQISGRAFERWINSLADRMGYGPNAAVRLILRGVAEVHSAGRVRVTKQTRIRRMRILKSSRSRSGLKKISVGSRNLVKYVK